MAALAGRAVSDSCGAWLLADLRLNFIEKAHRQGKPFFVWLNAIRMHVWTHLKEESDGVLTGIGLYADGMVRTR